MMSNPNYSWRRKVNKYTPLVAGLTGLLFVASSLLFLDHITVWFTLIIVGLAALQGGVWYAAHPFLTSERRFLGLRNELDRFVTLVRQLNEASLDPSARHRFESVKSEMLQSVERMAELAGKEGFSEAREPASV